MILRDDHYNAIWDKVYNILQFRPSVDTNIIPFTIAEKYVVFDISETKDTFDKQSITNAFIGCLTPGEKMYALNWEHSAFLFDPRDPEQMKSVYVEDERYLDGGYYALFPSYFPDGDYYFFIHENFRFGYLSHPWRDEVWIFGECLIEKFDTLYREFGWKKKEDISSLN